MTRTTRAVITMERATMIFRKDLAWYAAALCTCLMLQSGCHTTQKKTETASLQKPVRLELGKIGKPKGPVQIRSGQMVLLPPYCPPVELRDADGKLVRRLDRGVDTTKQPQALDISPGRYFIVGHGPVAGEHILLVDVTDP